MTDPDWSDFKILVALARGGSVAGAARFLAIDHSTVSRRLAALEESVGVCLIVRSAREFSWTAAGRTMLAAAEAIDAVVTEATRSVRSEKQETQGTVRVSVPPGVSAELSRILLAARERNPRLAIELCAEGRTVDLAKGEADLALRMFRPSEPGLVCRQTFEVGWVVCASKAYVAAHGMPASIDDLSNHRVVAYIEAMQRVAGPRWLEDHRGTAPTSMQVDNTEVAAHVIASGVGIGIVPSFVAAARPELVRVFPEPVAFNAGFIVYHETVRDTARLRAAVELLVEVFAENARVFSGRTAQQDA